MVPPAGANSLPANVDIVILFVQVGAAGTDKSRVRFALDATPLLGVLVVAPLARSAALCNGFVAPGSVVLALAFGPAGLRTFQPIDLQVDELRCEVLEEFLGVVLGVLATAGLVEQDTHRVVLRTVEI